eukprot:TRINITY_DN6013_c0_g1_i1.p1 TRINITY_DN6013_c0_g1~~TRINITY_DN6013_c0_g1_i1.p1  ORF type:complete len:557 (-),score=173.03 TRINITY_DN6013_c0_g1_i1:345-1793(-)
MTAKTYPSPDGSLEEAVKMKAPGGGADFLFKKSDKKRTEKKISELFIDHGYTGNGSLEQFISTVKEGTAKEFELEHVDACVRNILPTAKRRDFFGGAKTVDLKGLAPSAARENAIDKAMDEGVQSFLESGVTKGSTAGPIDGEIDKNKTSQELVVNPIGCLPRLYRFGSGVSGFVAAEEEEALLFHPPLESVRADKWTDVIQKWESWSDEKKKKTKQRVRKHGITDRLRGTVWNCFLDTAPLKEAGEYQLHLGQESGSEDMINEDIRRAFLNHVYFFEDSGKGRAALTSVLNAHLFSQKEQTYQRALGSAAYLLLLHMSDEEAFYCLKRLGEDANGFTEQLFLPGAPGLLKLAHLFHFLLEQSLPRVHQCFEKEGLTVSLFVLRWFRSMFLETLPFQYVVRIFDVVVAEGARFFLRAGLAILKQVQSEIVKRSFDGLLLLLQSPGPFLKCSPEELVRVAVTFTISNTKFDKASKEYDALMGV